MERRTSDDDDLGLKRPNNPPFCTADFYGDAGRFWQPIASGNPSSMGMRMFPFTTAQWQELQRQALIYKHIVASVPVPPDLLLPSAARSFPEAPTIFLPPAAMVVGRGGGTNLRFANGSIDPEPGRCRRTDGKKWRCSRDAAPDQKYCERHLHRCRPRSRKPVEQRRTRCKFNVNAVDSGTTTAASPAAKGKSPASSSAAGVAGAAAGAVPNIELNLPFQAMEPSCHEQRPDWSESYSGNLSSNWFTYLDPNLTSLEETHAADYSEPPRRFIDAWSSENMAEAAATASNPDDPSLSCRDKLYLSNLTLSMSNAAEDGTDNIIKSQPLNWMSSDSPLGGPLAEVLQSSNMTSPRDSVNSCSNKGRADLINLMGSCGGSQEASPRDSPLRALASSPSGVLQKAFVSLSDSSSNSSPTFAAAASRSDFAFQWMNLNN